MFATEKHTHEQQIVTRNILPALVLASSPQNAFIAALLKPLFVRPQAQRGIGDVKDLFAVRHGVVSVFQFGWIVPFHHFMKIGVAKIHAFNFLLRQFSRAIGNGEAAFGRTMDQVRRGTKIIF
jgi:hypothetical protein